MKKQNASNKLTFNKAAIAELNDSHLKSIGGGVSSYSTVPITTTFDFTVIADWRRTTTSSIA